MAGRFRYLPALALSVDFRQDIVMGLLALTHVPSPNMAQCELTHRERTPLNLTLARQQHRQYCRLLADSGAEVVTLEMNKALPDCCFVEDTAVVLDELAVLASMGAASRRPEVAGIEPVIRRYRPVYPVQFPATLDGGDVVRVGRNILVGISSRTNAAGVSGLKSIVAPPGYRVTPVLVEGCLHLKSACTALPDGRLLVNPAWLDQSALDEFHCVQIPAIEPDAADCLSLGQTVCLPAAFPRTAELIGRLGFPVKTVELSEFAKAEGGITCLSLVFEH